MNESVNSDNQAANDDNSAYKASADEIRSFIERFETLEAEKKELAEHQKVIMQEAKSRGYEPKILRQVVKLRAKDPAEISEEATLLELYKTAIGMS